MSEEMNEQMSKQMNGKKNEEKNEEKNGEKGEVVVEKESDNLSKDSSSKDSSSKDNSSKDNSSSKIKTKLSPELIIKAEIEVNEKETWRDRDIEALREIVLGESLLNSQTDDMFLLRFLRARLFDYDRAFELIKQYYYVQVSNPELFIAPSKLKQVFQSNLITLLPDKTDKHESVMVVNVGKWDYRLYNFDTLLAGCVVSIELALLDCVTQIGGLVCIVDMSELSWAHLRRFGPSQAKKVVHIIQNCLPVRFKAIHVINESTIADIGFTIIRPFLSEEFRNKIIFHGSNLSNLYSTISPDILPCQFGGTLGEIDSRPWFDQLMSHEHILLSSWHDYGLKKSHDLGDFIYDSGIDRTGLFRKSQTCNGYLFDYYKPSRAE